MIPAEVFLPCRENLLYYPMEFFYLLVVRILKNINAYMVLTEERVHHGRWLMI